MHSIRLTTPQLEALYQEGTSRSDGQSVCFISQDAAGNTWLDIADGRAQVVQPDGTLSDTPVHA